MENKWMFNTDYDGIWQLGDYYDTPEEAEKAAEEYLEPHESIYIGQCKTIPLPTYIDPIMIFENLDEYYRENAGEAFEDEYLFDTVSQEDQTWLEEKFSELMTEFYKRANIHSTCFSIENTYKYRD